VDENDAIVEAAGGAKRLVTKILNQTSKGIYVCFADRVKTAASQRRKVWPS
jgi:hypothetical protein